MPPVPARSEQPGDPQPVATPKRRRLLVGCTVAAGSLILALVGVELIFRILVPVTDVPFYFWDPLVGPRRKPNQTGRYVAGRHVNARYHFNAQGWNHPQDYLADKPEGTRRICLVGDSYVEALQVDPQETLFAVAERRMSRPDCPVEWYAFGCSGFGTTQEYSVIRHYVLDYQPDVVIILFTQNDPLDSSPYLAPIERYVGTYCLNDHGELSALMPAYWKPAPWRRLATRLAVVRYLYLQTRLFQRPRRQPATGEVLLREVTAGTRFHRINGLTEMLDEQRREATWELIEKTLAAARDECRRRGSLLALAFRGSPDEIEAPITARPYTPPPRQEDPYCLGARRQHMGREFLAPMARRLGIPYLDLADPLQEAVAKTGQSHRFPDDGHYSGFGHAAAGEALADWMETIWEQSGVEPAEGR